LKAYGLVHLLHYQTFYIRIYKKIIEFSTPVNYETMQKFTFKFMRIMAGKTGWTCLFILILSLNSFGQARTVKGSVAAADTKQTLPGASIIIKGTTTATMSDMDGNFSISVPAEQAILVISFVGYTTKEVDITSQFFVSVFLEPKKETLDEVVVIGYGTVKKSDLTGSVASIKAEDITRITSSNPVQSLAGRVTGVQVTSTTGAPGDDPTVRIRGVGTFNNTSPIYVVDGVILDNISFLNAADIESMEVLKDASATAIYGSRGANGVIMVTTKGGKIDQQKTIFNFTGEAGIQSLAKKIDLLNGKEFATIANEIKTGSYNNVDLVPNTDWQDLVFDIAPIQNYQLSVSGASKAMQYYLGVGYFNQKGIIDKSSYEKITVKFNSIYNLNSFLKLGTNISVMPFSQRIAPNVTYAAYRALPTIEPYYPDGSFASVENIGNPLADLANSNNYRKGVRGVGNIYAEFKIHKDFTLKSSYGLDGEYVKATNFTPAFTVYNADGSASQQSNVLSDLVKANSDNFSWLWETTLNYHKEIKKHAIDALAGYTMQNTTSELYSITGANIIRNGESFWYIAPQYLEDAANGVNTVNLLKDEVDANLYYSMISYLFRVNYTFNNKYILTATFRRDGSSKFAKENRYSNFPSFAAGWNISQEKFMENISFISKLKLRASWGQIGNEKITYFDRFSLVDDKIVAVFGESTTFPGASFGKLGNPDLKWEISSQTDAGMELGVLNNRLTGEFDYYYRATNDILVELSTPGYYGNGEGAKVRFNAAKVLNSGFEYNVGWRSQVKDFTYNISFLGSTVHNEVLEIGGNSGVDSVLVGGNLDNGIPVTRSRVGLPIGAFYGLQTNGVFQTQEEIDAYPRYTQAPDPMKPGDLKYVDINNDGVINDLDRTYLGSPIPKFIFGLVCGFEYKNFDFSLHIEGQTGNKIYNAKEMVRPDPYNFEAHVMDRWTGPGTSNSEPRPSYGGNNYLVSDKYIYDGSFIRFRNVVFGYTLPAEKSKKINVQSMRFYIKADNLYTFTKFTGYTPEIGSTDVLSNGIDKGIYPVTAVYTFGINLTF
jgi:TonB-linked SusC/RagA family outer membrane protein